MARKFFYVCAGLFLLAGAFSLGARSVGAQRVDEIIGYSVGDSGNYQYVLMTNGDVYGREANGAVGPLSGSAQYLGNFFGGTTPAERHSLGQLKQRFHNGGGK